MLKLTRSKLESLVGDLVSRTIDPCRVALKGADPGIDDIDDVILVGNQTRMPLVQEQVKELFRKKRDDVDPDEAVAMGAPFKLQCWLVTSKTCSCWT